jgi:hypothetical protein
VMLVVAIPHARAPVRALTVRTVDETGGSR